MVFTRDGEVIATGAGAAALGNPAAAVAWLVRTLHPLGASLPAGQFVMTGALHAAVAVTPARTYRAEFDRLGPVGLPSADRPLLPRAGPRPLTDRTALKGQPVGLSPSSAPATSAPT